MQRIDTLGIASVLFSRRGTAHHSFLDLGWLSLPIEIESHRQQVGLACSEYRLLGSKRMNPIKHDTRSIGPVPIETRGEVVIAPAIEVIEIKEGPTGLGFPGARTKATRDHEEIRVRNVATELGPMLSKAFKDAILSGEKKTSMNVASMNCRRIASDHVNAGEEGLALEGEGPKDRCHF